MSRAPDNGDTRNTLPIKRLAEGETWERIGSNAFPSPIHWSKEAGGRFNPASEDFGVCYMAADLRGAVAESICRNVAGLDESQKFTSETALARKSRYQITLQKELCVLDFTVPNLAAYRLDALITSEYNLVEVGGIRKAEYRWGPLWADHASRIGLDGILYRSRHHTDAICLALFERPPAGLYANCLSDCNTDAVLEVLEEDFDWGLEPP